MEYFRKDGVGANLVFARGGTQLCRVVYATRQIRVTRAWPTYMIR
ncbi:MAG: hypothetical protein V3V52_06795 [Candidatus Adiutricales bacterium]